MSTKISTQGRKDAKTWTLDDEWTVDDWKELYHGIEAIKAKILARHSGQFFCSLCKTWGEHPSSQCPSPCALKPLR